MFRLRLGPLLVGVVSIHSGYIAVRAQSPTSATAAADHATVSITTAGQMLTLNDVRIVSGIPRSSGSATASTRGGTPSVSAQAAHPSGQVVFDLASMPDSIASRLSDNRKCATTGRGEVCRVEASVDVVGADGSPISSYFMHGAWIAGLKLGNRAAGSTGRTGRLTVHYDELEAMPGVAVAGTTPAARASPNAVSVASPASVMTTSGGTVDTAPSKKHKFGKFVAALVRDHGLQAVELATGIGAASMAMHTLNLSRGAGGSFNASSQSQLLTLAQSIKTTPGSHLINIGPPPGTQAGMMASPQASQAWAALVRKQLIRQGADSSRFTIATTRAAEPPSGGSGQSRSQGSQTATSAAASTIGAAGTTKVP